MEEQLISFETAKLAKQKGFDIITKEMYGCQVIPQLESYNETKWVLYKDYCYAPTQSLLQRWLREKYKISVEVSTESCYYSVAVVNQNKNYNSYYETHYKMWEEALESGLLNALKQI